MPLLLIGAEVRVSRTRLPVAAIGVPVLPLPCVGGVSGLVVVGAPALLPGRAGVTMGLLSAAPCWPCVGVLVAGVGVPGWVRGEEEVAVSLPSPPPQAASMASRAAAIGARGILFNMGKTFGGEPGRRRAPDGWRFIRAGWPPDGDERQARYLQSSRLAVRYCRVGGNQARRRLAPCWQAGAVMSFPAAGNAQGAAALLPDGRQGGGVVDAHRHDRVDC